MLTLSRCRGLIILASEKIRWDVLMTVALMWVIAVVPVAFCFNLDINLTRIATFSAGVKAIAVVSAAVDALFALDIVVSAMSSCQVRKGRVAAGGREGGSRAAEAGNASVAAAAQSLRQPACERRSMRMR